MCVLFRPFLAFLLIPAPKVFDTRYFTAISAADASHIISEEDFDASGSTSGIRPTNSALQVAELVQQLSGARFPSSFSRARRQHCFPQTVTDPFPRPTPSHSCSPFTSLSSHRTPNASLRPWTPSSRCRLGSFPARWLTVVLRRLELEECCGSFGPA